MLSSIILKIIFKKHEISRIYFLCAKSSTFSPNNYLQAFHVGFTADKKRDNQAEEFDIQHRGSLNIVE